MHDYEAAIDGVLSGSDASDDFSKGNGWVGEENEMLNFEALANGVSDFEGFNFEGEGWSDKEQEFDDFDSFMPDDEQWDSESNQAYEFDDYAEENESSIYGFDGEWSNEPTGGLLTDEEIDELAYEFVSLATAQEMEAFLGKVFGGIAKKVGGALKGSLGRKVMRAGSSLLGRALPVVGSALGTAILPGFGTGVGGALGGQLRSLFSRSGRKTLGRSMTRRALSSARRAARSNPLTGLLNRGGGRMVRSMFGFELEATHDDPRTEVARRVLRTVADAANSASRNGHDSETAVFGAFREASDLHLPPAIRASLIALPVADRSFA